MSAPLDRREDARLSRSDHRLADDAASARSRLKARRIVVDRHLAKDVAARLLGPEVAALELRGPPAGGEALVGVAPRNAARELPPGEVERPLELLLGRALQLERQLAHREGRQGARALTSAARRAASFCLG